MMLIPLETPHYYSPANAPVASVNCAWILLSRLQGATSFGELVQDLQSKKMISAITAICAFQDTEGYVDVDDILNLPLFSCDLQIVRTEMNHWVWGNLRRLISSMSQTATPSAAIITRATRVITVVNLPLMGKAEPPVLIVFDGYPRSEHSKGHNLAVFRTEDSAVMFLSNCFSSDQAEVLGGQAVSTIYKAYIVQHHLSTEEERLNSVFEANMRLLSVTNKLKSALTHASTMETDRLMDNRSILGQNDRTRGSSPDKNTPRQNGKAIDRHGGREYAQVSSPLSPVLRNSEHGKRKSTSNSRPKETTQNASSSATNKAVVYDSMEPSFSLFNLPASNTTGSRSRITQTDQPGKSFGRGESSSQIRAHLDSERNDFEKVRQKQMESEREHLQASRLKDKPFECAICTDKYTEDEISRVDACGHNLCRKCMRDYIAAEIDQRRWPVICPLCRAQPQHSLAHGEISRKLAEHVGVSPRVMDKWDEVELMAISVPVECPSCHKVTPVDRVDYEAAEMLWCQYGCKAYWCKKCSQLAERGMRHTCDGEAEFERWRTQQGDVRQCPGCMVPIQRKEGCRHMVCIKPGCNTHFCDACGQRLIRSVNKMEIDAAVRRHFSLDCKLFDYDSS
ncbi:hypothetical protein CPB86DRAFT_854687 [Serendipita vermifera]|nr:hypothetical protein CPB86DRAFT_854687 [Serendipita vermifera]